MAIPSAVLKLITASNGQNVKVPNIRLIKTLRGGPLGDVGIYCLNAFRYLSGEEPSEVFATAQYRSPGKLRRGESPRSYVHRKTPDDSTA